MASPQLDAIKQMLKGRPVERADLSPQDARAGFEMMTQVLQVKDETKREAVSANGVPGEWITNDASTDAVTLYYLHGGGYSIGSVNTHATMVSQIARAAKARALSMDYRLAPEHPFPAALDDALAGYGWLLAQGIDSKRIVIGGDSAGGGLAAATLVALRDAGDPLPGAAVLLSPWTDLAGTGESMQTRAELDPMIPAMEGVSPMALWYTGDRPATDPLISPLYADLHGLPPLLIHVGDHEVLLSDSTRFAEKAEAAGVDVTLKVWDEMIHVFQFFPMLPEGQQAIAEIGEWVKSKIATKAGV
jgi:acetyl esterase/lipase